MTADSTSRSLRRKNRSEVLRELLRGGETTRGALGATLGLSATTITKVIVDLIAEGLVHETGQLPSEGGRPTATIGPRPEGAYLVGANIGDQSVTAEVFDLSFRSISKVSIPVSSHDAPAQALSVTLTAAIDRALAEAGSPSVSAIGLGMPGIVETPAPSSVGGARGPIMLYAQSLGWPPTAIDALYGRADVPVLADNASKRLAAAETWFGAARDVADGVVALFGRGVGVGVISGGRILQGTVSSAGEWGHTKISFGGPVCNCGARGCLEAYVGAIGIARRWKALGGDPSENEELAFGELLASSEGGDEAAQRIVVETLEIMGIGLGNLVNIFNPERVIVGGWLGLRLGNDHLHRLTALTRAAALERPAQQFELVRAQVSSDAFDLGAALLAAEALIREPARPGRSQRLSW